jgi:predicted RNA-binding protein with PUA-like domain
MAKRWLFKEEPGNYHFGRLEEDGSATWDGVRNNWAQKNLRSIRTGDAVLYYHTGKERAVVGIAEVTTDPYPDPTDDSLVVVDIEPVRRLERPVKLAEIKASPEFDESPLVRMGRLSVVPITAGQWKVIEKLARS